MTAPRVAIGRGKMLLGHESVNAERPTYTRDPLTGARVPIHEFDACGTPLPWPEVVGAEVPSCSAPEPEEDDESIPFYPAMEVD